MAAIGLMLAPSAGADKAVAEAAFVRGEYDAALTALAETETADAFALCARALLAEAMSGPADPPEDLLFKALDEANAALMVDPAHAEGRLQRAIALSLIIRPMSTREARKTGWAEEARDLARDVLEDEPGNVYAHGFLSVWNVEVVNRGGRIGAMIMGAGVSDGRDHYEAAIAAAPDDASVHWQWARALAALNARKYHDEVLAALDAALAAAVDSELERVMQARAAMLKAEMLRDDRRAQEIAAGML
jgi:tetratricopeptide (TPR) repeat protein